MTVLLLPAIVPPEADQVTAVFDVPLTVAVKFCVAPGKMFAKVGARETEIPAAESVKFTPVTFAPLIVALRLLGLNE
jgi:hypothetical protein